MVLAPGLDIKKQSILWAWYALVYAIPVKVCLKEIIQQLQERAYQHYS